MTTISRGTFTFCFALRDVTLPRDLKIIESEAFSYCSGLESIRIPSGTAIIRSRAFFSCNRLKSIFIPESVAVIEENAFKDCSKLTIYCEASERPNGWQSNWNVSNCSVVWGYKPESLEGEEAKTLDTEDVKSPNIRSTK